MKLSFHVSVSHVCHSVPSYAHVAEKFPNKNFGAPVFVTFLDEFQKVVYQNSRIFKSEFMLATVQRFRILET